MVPELHRVKDCEGERRGYSTAVGSLHGRRAVPKTGQYHRILGHQLPHATAAPTGVPPEANDVPMWVQRVLLLIPCVELCGVVLRCGHRWDLPSKAARWTLAPGVDPCSLGWGTLGLQGSSDPHQRRLVGVQFYTVLSTMEPFAASLIQVLCQRR